MTTKELKWKTHSEAVKQEGDEDSRKFSFVFSSGEVDRDNDIIEQDGIDLKHFKKNPVVLWAHDFRVPPVARVPATWLRDGKLMGTVEFPPEGVSPMSDTLAGLTAAGFINATSIGFMPKKHVFNDERGGFDFTEIELYEVSLVPVGSNRDALRKAAAKGALEGPAQEIARAFFELADGAEVEANAKEMQKLEAQMKAIEEKLDKLAAGEIKPKPRPVRVIPADSEQKKAIESAVLSALKSVAAREVSYHTGRLDD